MKYYDLLGSQEDGERRGRGDGGGAGGTEGGTGGTGPDGTGRPRRAASSCVAAAGVLQKRERGAQLRVSLQDFIEMPRKSWEFKRRRRKY